MVPREACEGARSRYSMNTFRCTLSMTGIYKTDLASHEGRVMLSTWTRSANVIAASVSSSGHTEPCGLLAESSVAPVASRLG